MHFLFFSNQHCLSQIPDQSFCHNHHNSSTFFFFTILLTLVSVQYSFFFSKTPSWYLLTVLSISCEPCGLWTMLTVFVWLWVQNESNDDFSPPLRITSQSLFTTDKTTAHLTLSKTLKVQFKMAKFRSMQRSLLSVSIGHELLGGETIATINTCSTVMGKSTN